jgi:tripartite-type tricarboxylate transporter receptor subunit TctC
MSKLTRRVVVAAGVLAPFVARAQSWPSGTIRIVVPFPAGGSVDAISRMVQPILQQRLGVNVIIENKPGASGSTGSAIVAKAPPDGQNWLMVFDTHAVNPFLIPNMPFDTEKDLDPVLLIGTAPHLICAHPSRPYKSLADVLADARARPDTITYGTIGTGSLGHLTMTLLSRRAGVKLVHVPYRGGGPLLTDTLGGHVDLSVASTGLLGPHLATGVTRPLSVTAKTRLKAAPNVPTTIEDGLAGFESYAWWGTFGSPGTSKPILERFQAELVAALKDERVSRQLVESQQINVVLGGPEILRGFVTEQMKLWGAVVRESGIKADST